MRQLLLLVCACSNPQPTGNLDDISTRALHILRNANLVLAEDTRHTRKLFTRFGLSTPMQSYHEHNERQRAPHIVQRVLRGEAIALVSDAGTRSRAVFSTSASGAAQACQELATLARWWWQQRWRRAP